MTNNKKIIYVAGARPNFVKLANVLKESKIKGISSLFVHTGQHYSKEMSDIFFEELNIDNPDINLGVGSNTHGRQTAEIMMKFEPILIKYKPEIVVVVGDVNSTLACSLVASKMNIKIAHIEAGLRSFDNYMPEEINRKLTDTISDFLFVSEESGIINLRKEGIEESKIYFVGNVMIDTLISNRDKINKSNILKRMSLIKNEYIVTTFHRPSNVDNKSSLKKIINILENFSANNKVIFPLHPRTLYSIEKYKLKKYIDRLSNVITINSLGYLDFMKLVSESKMVITDSGGIQEETTFLRIPCFTIRKNTERPSTVAIGTNHLVNADFESICKKYDKFVLNKSKYKCPDLWDGKSSKRIIEILYNNLS